MSFRRLGEPLTEEERLKRHKELYGTTTLPPRGTGLNPGGAGLQGASFREPAALGWVTDDTKTVTIRVVGEGKGELLNLDFPATAAPGERATGTFDVKNTGNMKAQFRDSTNLYPAGTPYWLEPGATNTISITFTMPSTDLTITITLERFV